MKFYTVYTNALCSNSLKLIPNGFSWLVFILGPIGFFLYRSWICGLIMVSLELLAFSLLQPSFMVFLFFHFILGCFAHSLQEWEAKLSGWNMRTLVAAENKSAAILRLLDHHPEWKPKFNL